MKIYPPSGFGNPITGQPAHILREGGRFRGKWCDCSAPLMWSPSDGGDTKACAKGESCLCIVGKLVWHFVKSRWSLGDVLAVAFDEANRGMIWLHCQDDPVETLSSLYERSGETIANNAAKRAEYEAGTRIPEDVFGHLSPDLHSTLSEAQEGTYDATGEGAGTSSRLRYQWGCWKVILGYVKDNPGAGMREIIDAVAARTGWRRGLVQKYVEKANRDGYLSYTVGKNRKHHHTFVKWPEPPKRPRLPNGELGHYTKSQSDHVATVLEMSPEQVEAEFEEDRDWQVQEATKARHRTAAGMPQPKKAIRWNRAKAPAQEPVLT